MSKARVSFEGSIKDAEDLLAHFDAMPKPPPTNAEVLKRAGLVMALTAWETYVEDRVREEVARRPTADKTRKLFIDFLEQDVTSGWEWANYDCAKAKKALDELISKRGDAVHRSKPLAVGAPPAPHLIKREELEKAIRFLRCLVDATDKVLGKE